MFKTTQIHGKPKYLPVGLCLVCGTTIAIAFSVLAKKWEDTNNQTQFQQRISNLTTALNRTVNRYTEILYSLQDLYDTSPMIVQRSQFNAFTDRAVSSYRGIQALEWAKKVSAAEKNAFEHSIQKSGHSKFQIYERDRNGNRIPVKKRSYYIPVIYINPWEQNEVALGFDLASDRQRRIALEKARNSGNITATGRIRLVQEQKDQYGFLVFLAIYKNKHKNNRHTPNEIETHREVEGYILGVFRVTDVIEESLQGINTDIDFKISYENSEQDFLGFYRSKTKSLLPKLPSQNRQTDSVCRDLNSCTRKISVGDQIWLIQFQPTESYSDRNRSWLPEAILIIGLMLTGALSSYLMGAIAELERTKELSELKLRLFSMASHEFRTPLSTILISAQLLETNSFEDSIEQSQRISRRIQSAAKRMNQLLADILTLSRAEAGKLEFDPEIINLNQFCHQLIEEFEYSLEVPRRITFIVIDELNPVFLDKKLLRSIVLNLLSNAIKYSSIHTPVKLEISSDRDFITLTISDRGIGIPLDECEKIFDGFYRAHNVGDIEGSGLGMTVVKTCTDLHGGKISLKSKLGEGTTFTVILPLKD